MRRTQFLAPLALSLACAAENTAGPEAVFRPSINPKTAWLLRYAADAEHFSAQLVYGRLGNHFVVLRHAISTAMCCAGLIELPAGRDLSVLQEDTGSMATWFSFAMPGAWHSMQEHNGEVVEAEGPLQDPQIILTDSMREDCKSSSQTLHDGTDYFYMQDAADWLRECVLYKAACSECEAQYVGGMLVNPQCSDLHHGGGENDLVIQLRSGDIWSENPNRLYGQPPLSWYAAVFAHRKWENITLVTEPVEQLEHHPFATLLPALLHRPYVTMVQSSNDFKEDMRTLLCARNLVTARSSVQSLLLWHNQHLRSAYVEGLLITTERYGEQQQEGTHGHAGCTNARTTIPLLVSQRPDVSFYVMGGEWAGNYSPYSSWQNTYEQRLEMLTYGFLGAAPQDGGTQTQAEDGTWGVLKC